MSRPWLGPPLAFACLLLVGAGCAPAIGDKCSNALDCSAQGSRPCDRTQPGGYCTIQGCEEGTCPSEAVCVKFRPQLERLAVTYCMLKCSSNSDCRTSEGYRCTSETDFGEPDAGDALVLGNPAQRFCSIPALPPSVMSAPSAKGSEDAGAQQDAGSVLAP